VLLQQSICLVSIEYTCNTNFVIHWLVMTGNHGLNMRSIQSTIDSTYIYQIIIQVSQHIHLSNHHSSITAHTCIKSSFKYHSTYMYQIIIQVSQHIYLSNHHSNITAHTVIKSSFKYHSTYIYQIIIQVSHHIYLSTHHSTITAHTFIKSSFKYLSKCGKCLIQVAAFEYAVYES